MQLLYFRAVCLSLLMLFLRVGIDILGCLFVERDTIPLFFLPTLTHAPRKRFAAATRLHHAPQVARAACVRGYDARAKSGAPAYPFAVPLGKGDGENPLARRYASHCRV